MWRCSSAVVIDVLLLPLRSQLHFLHVSDTRRFFAVLHPSRLGAADAVAYNCGRAGYERPSRSPSRRSAGRLRGSSRTGRLLQEQSSVAHRLQPSPAHAAWPIAWHNGARHHNRRHSRARVAPRRSGSASAAREQAWPRCRPGVRRVLLSIAQASVGAERLVRTRGMLHPRNLLDRLALDEVLAPDPADRLHCQHSPTARLESKRAAYQANLKGVNFGRRSPSSGGALPHQECYWRSFCR